MEKSEAKIALKLDKLQKEICLAEQELLVRHNKNIGHDLRILIRNKRKLANYLKEKGD